MFIGADEFLFVATGYRVVTMRGRYGSGKTLLMVALATELWRRRVVEHIYGNLTLKGDWNEPVPAVVRDAAVLYDESWRTLDARSSSGFKESQRWLAFLRKRKLILLLASVLNVDVRFRTVVVQRQFAFGERLWMYRWQVDDGLKPYVGSFGLSWPLRYAAIYDHLEEPDEDKAEVLARAMSGKGIEGLEESKGPMPPELMMYDPDVLQPVRFVERGS